MSGVAIRLDTREFTAAMREYIAATGKDSVEAINRQARNFAVKCIMHTKKAKGAAAIRALQSESWWPKFIAKVIARQAGGKASQKAFQSQWAAAEQARRLSAGGVKGAFKLDKEERSYVRYAKQLSRKILGSRAAAITFLQFFFRVVAQKMSQYAKGNSAQEISKRFPDFATNVLPARAGNTTVKIDSAYQFRKRGTKTSQSTERLLQEAMNKALPATIDDMKQYTEKKLAQRAAQYSGKKAA